MAVVALATVTGIAVAGASVSGATLVGLVAAFLRPRNLKEIKFGEDTTEKRTDVKSE